jgi:hypothetical protein
VPTITAPATLVVASGSLSDDSVPVVKSLALVEPAAAHAPSPRRNVLADAVPELPSWASVIVPVRPATLATGPYFAASVAKSEIADAVCVCVEGANVLGTFVRFA